MDKIHNTYCPAFFLNEKKRTIVLILMASLLNISLNIAQAAYVSYQADLKQALSYIALEGLSKHKTPVSEMGETDMEIQTIIWTMRFTRLFWEIHVSERIGVDMLRK